MTTAVKMKTVSGVDLAKVSRTALKKSFEETLKKSADAEIPKLVEELAEHFAKTTKGKDILECSNCGGGSPGDLFPDFCPFCGEADDGESASPEGEEERVSAAPSATAKVPEAPKSEPKAKKTPVPKTEPKKVEEKAMEVASAPSATEKDLDAAILKVQASRNAGVTALWTLACELRRIHEQDLWKLRNGEGGKPKYKAFSKFLADEVELHERTVYRMIEVTRQFSEDQAKRFGVSILQGLLAAPKEDREEILDKVEAGKVKGTRGVNREVAEIRKRKGVKVVPGEGKKKGTRGSAKAAQAASEKAEKRKVVTVAVPAGRKTVKLFARSEKKTDDPKRAKRLADRPWGKLEATNGVTLFFAIAEDANGELTLSVEARRED